MKLLGRIALLFVGLTIAFALSSAFGHDSGHSSSHSNQNQDSSNKKKEDQKKSDNKASPTPVARMTAFQAKPGASATSNANAGTGTKKTTTTRRIATKAKPSATISITNSSQIPDANLPVPGSGVKVGTGTKNSGAPDTTTTTSGGTTTSAGSKFTGPSDSNTNPFPDSGNLPKDGSLVGKAIQNGAGQTGDTAHPGDFAPNKGLTAITDADAALIAAGAKGPALTGNKSGADLINGAGTNPSEPTGPSKQSQQSEDDNKTNEYGGETRQATMGNTTAFVKEDANGVTRETFVINMATGLARTTHFDASGKQSGAAITRDQNGSVVYDKNDTRTSVGARQATSKQPNPETDTGDHVPSNIVGDLNGKLPTIGQAAEQKRNLVTMPGEGRNNGPKQNVDPIEALKNGVGQRTDGRINPINDDGTTTSKNIGPGKPGSGLEQVDKTTKPGSALGGNPKPPGAPGTGPDNPTSDSGPNGSPHP